LYGVGSLIGDLLVAGFEKGGLNLCSLSLPFFFFSSISFLLLW